MDIHTVGLIPVWISIGSHHRWYKGSLPLRDSFSSYSSWDFRLSRLGSDSLGVFLGVVRILWCKRGSIFIFVTLFDTHRCQYIYVLNSVRMHDSGPVCSIRLPEAPPLRLWWEEAPIHKDWSGQLVNLPSTQTNLSIPIFRLITKLPSRSSRLNFMTPSFHKS